MLGCASAECRTKNSNQLTTRAGIGGTAKKKSNILFMGKSFSKQVFSADCTIKPGLSVVDTRHYGWKWSIKSTIVRGYESGGSRELPVIAIKTIGCDSTQAKSLFLLYVVV